MLLGVLALGGLGLGTILLTQSRGRRRSANQGPDQALIHRPDAAIGRSGGAALGSGEKVPSYGTGPGTGVDGRKENGPMVIEGPDGIKAVTGNRDDGLYHTAADDLAERSKQDMLDRHEQPGQRVFVTTDSLKQSPDGGGSLGGETGHSTTGPGDGYSSGRGHVVSSTSSTSSGHDGNDGKGDGKVSGKGEGKEGKGYGASSGGDSGTDGKKETGTDGKDTGTGTDKPKPTKGDSSTPGPDGGADGNTGGHGLFRPGQGFAGGTGPDPNIEHVGRPGGLGDLNTGPGQTGGRSTGEPDLDSNSGGDINAAHPGVGGRLAPSEGVGTDVGNPASG